MSVNTHFNALNAKHLQLEAEIRSAYNNHLPDNMITELKKQKLHLKEEMLRLQGMVDTVAA